MKTIAEQETLIACVYEHEAGYIGVGLWHEVAKDMLMNSSFWSAEITDDSGFLSRKMMTNNGHVVSMERAWDIGKELGMVDEESLETLVNQQINHAKENGHETSRDEVLTYTLGSDYFEEILSEFGDLDTAREYAEKINANIKENVGTKKSISIARRFEMEKGRGG